MRRLILLLLLIAALPAAVAHGQAPTPVPAAVPHGQAPASLPAAVTHERAPKPASTATTPTPVRPTPSPTPIPTVGPPSIASAKAATIAAGAAGYTFDEVSTVPGQSQLKVHDSGQVSFARSALHLIQSAVRTQLNKSHRSETRQSELTIVGARGAWRSAGQGWQCQQLRSGDVTAQLLAFQITPTSRQKLGAVTVGGVHAVRIRARGTISTWSGGQVDNVEYDVDPATNRVLRVSSTFTAWWGRVRQHVTLTERYSHYGGPVHITLLKQCQGKSRSRLGLR